MPDSNLAPLQICPNIRVIAILGKHARDTEIINEENVTLRVNKTIEKADIMPATKPKTINCSNSTLYRQQYTMTTINPPKQ